MVGYGILNPNVRQLAKFAVLSEVVVHHYESDCPLGISNELGDFAIRNFDT
jgi:hypothetical protein